MEVIVGKTAGFCYGVRRAVNGAKEEVKKFQKMFCLGEIVHNKDVVRSLEDLGMHFIENIEEAKGKTLVRAHGIAKKIYRQAKQKGIELIDYTCPNVLKIHGIVQKYAENNYYIFLLGTPNHPENIGTISYCGKYYSVIEKEEDTFEALKALNKSKKKNLLVIAQTTYSLEKFNKIENIIKNNLHESINLEIRNTICKATELRQKETEELSKKVDFMIIIGGKNSSNTRKLYDIAKANCSAILIENISELETDLLADKEKIGIMAGASTPKESIDAVYESLKEKVLY